MSRTSVLIVAGFALGSLFSFGAGAFPVASSGSQSAGNIIFVAEGCGRGEHREHRRCVLDRPLRHVCGPHHHYSEFRHQCVHD